MIDDQVEDRRLDKVAESTALGIGPPEVTAQKSVCKILAKVTPMIRISDGGQQIAVDSPAVALHQHVLGHRRRISLALVSLKNFGPAGRDLAQTLVQLRPIHEYFLSASLLRPKKERPGAH